MKVKKLKRTLLFFHILFLCNTYSDEISSSDFAFGFNLNFESGKGIYETLLPLKVYESVTNEDLKDLSVFNSKSEIVPHEISSQGSKYHEEEIMPPKNLRIFPLDSKGENDSGLKDIKIKTNDSGVVVEVQNLQKDKKSQNKIFSGYIVYNENNYT